MTSIEGLLRLPENETDRFTKVIVETENGDILLRADDIIRITD